MTLRNPAEYNPEKTPEYRIAKALELLDARLRDIEPEATAGTPQDREGVRLAREYRAIHNAIAALRD